ncbi:transaldolase family protein [Fibrobacterota bacterium]
MDFLADTADTKELKEVLDYFPLKGVTTNPTIISKAERPLSQIVPEIGNLIEGKALHIQLNSPTAGKMLKEARTYQSYFDLGENFFAKIPLSLEGLKAIPMVKDAGIKVTATAVFTALQAQMAAAAGADYAVPYVNRLDINNSSGVQVISDIITLFEQSEVSCQVLGASFKNLDQVFQSGLAGAHAVTLSPDLLKLMLLHPLTDAAVREFRKDGARFYDVFK